MNTRRLMTLNLSLLLAGALALGGCQDDGDVAAPDLDTTNVQAAGMTLPDASELSQELGADQEQSENLAAALSRWENTLEKSGPDVEAGTPPPSPMMGFLAEVSTFLDHEQKLELVQILSEQREQWRQDRAQRRDGSGRGKMRGAGHGPRGDRVRGQSRLLGEFADELDLTAEQKEQLETLQAEMREQMLELRGDRPRGGGPSEEMREQAAALREEHREKVQEILTEQQLERLQELREQRRSERGAERQERREARAARQLENLSVILDLSDEQKSSIEEIMSAQQAKIEEIREGFRAEYHDGPRRPSREVRESHRALFDDIREEGRAQVRELLDQEQQELFDALEELRPERGRQGGAGMHGGHGKSGRGHGGRGHRGGGPRR